MNQRERELRSVRWAQLSLIRQHLSRLEEAMDGMPPVDSCLGPNAIPYSDQKLADSYLELMERIELTTASLKKLHFSLCGRFANEIRALARE